MTDGRDDYAGGRRRPGTSSGEPTGTARPAALASERRYAVESAVATLSDETASDRRRYPAARNAVGLHRSADSHRVVPVAVSAMAGLHRCRFRLVGRGRHGPEEVSDSQHRYGVRDDDSEGQGSGLHPGDEPEDVRDDEDRR